MSLLIRNQSLKSIADQVFQSQNLASHVDFSRQEWRITCLPHEQNDVEIHFLFQFDLAYEAGFFEVFHNGMDENVLKYSILEPIKSQLPSFVYILN